MKRTLLTLGATAMLATGALAQIDELMRRDRLGELEATTAVAIARGLGLRLDYVVRVKRELGTEMWNLGPVFYISERSNLDPRQIWNEHRRGAGWMEIDRDRGRGSILRDGYGEPRRGERDDEYRYGDDRYGDDRYGENRFPDRNDRYDDAYRNRRGGLADLIGDILGRRDNDDYYRENRGRYGRNGDREYEQRVWDEILRRAHGHGVGRTWQFLERGARIGDLVMASHIARVARTQPERVMDEFMRNRNWNRVRERYNIASDWESQGRNRNTRDNRGRNQGRDIWDDIYDIIR